MKLLCRCQYLRWEPGVASGWGPGLVVRDGLAAALTLCCWFLCYPKKGISMKSEVLISDLMADNWLLCSFCLLTGRSMRCSPTWGAWRPQTRSQCTVSDEGGREDELLCIFNPVCLPTAFTVIIGTGLAPESLWSAAETHHPFRMHWNCVAV